MPNPNRFPSPHRTCLALAAAALATASVPALAQTVEELTVTGRLGPAGEIRELSRAVSYSDLDLTTEGGRDVLKVRIKDTARDLCRELGETATATTTGPVPSCQDAAVSDAMKQARVVFDTAVPRAAAEPAPAPQPASAAPSYGQQASVTVQTLTNGPVPDTPENRERYGAPMSNAGKRTAPAGN